MAVWRRAVIAALVSALVWAGVRPVDHLHAATLAHPTIIHAHFEGTESATTHAGISVHDGHDDAVQLDRVAAVGPVTHPAGQPAVLRQSSWASVVEPVKMVRPDSEKAPPPSPPPRSAAPRAPPA